MNDRFIKERKKHRTNVRHGQEKLPPGLPSLKKWFQKSNLPLTEQQYNHLWQYHTLLRDKNAEYDLTRIHQFDNMVQKHYIDCVLVAKLMQWKLPSPILDVGTGAGFPAIPLKIVCSETEFILSEGRHKRIQFLREVVEALGLQGVEIYGGKIYASFGRPVKGVITRAVESIPETLVRVKKSLLPGGKAIFMKGPHCDGEIQDALHTLWKDYRLEQDISYTIPHTPHHRRLVIFERLENITNQSVQFGHNVHEIESPANKTFKDLKALLTPKGIKKHGHALIFGRKITREVIRDFPEFCVGWIFSPRKNKIAEELSEELFEKCPRKDMVFYQLSHSLYNELDVFGTGADILLVKTPPVKKWEVAETGMGCTLMIPFQDPENLGVVIRAAAGFGVKDIILLQEATNPYHPKSIRAGGSAIFRVNFQKGPSLSDLESSMLKMQKEGIPLVTLSMEGTDIRHFTFPAKFILLPGMEGQGLPQSLRSSSLAILMEPGNESLNVAVATAIALYEWKRGKGTP